MCGSHYYKLKYQWYLLNIDLVNSLYYIKLGKQYTLNLISYHVHSFQMTLGTHPAFTSQKPRWPGSKQSLDAGKWMVTCFTWIIRAKDWIYWDKNFQKLVNQTELTSSVSLRGYGSGKVRNHWVYSWMRWNLCFLGFFCM